MNQDSYTSSKLMLFSPLLGLLHTPGTGQLCDLVALSGILCLPTHTALLAQSRKPLVSLTGYPSCPTGQELSLRYTTGRAPQLVLQPPTHSLECGLSVITWKPLQGSGHPPRDEANSTRGLCCLLPMTPQKFMVHLKSDPI